MTKRELIDRMKAANATGNFGFPEGILAEWTATQRARKANGETAYDSLVDPTSGRIVASIDD
jgi:hypothetical protein